MIDFVTRLSRGVGKDEKGGCSAGLRARVRKFCEGRQRLREASTQTSSKTTSNPPTSPNQWLTLCILGAYRIGRGKLACGLDSCDDDEESMVDRSESGEISPATAVAPHPLADSTAVHYTTGVSKVVSAVDGRESCVALLPDRNLADMIQQAILENRETGFAEENAGAALASLKDSLESVRLDIEEAEEELAELRMVKDKDTSPRVQKWTRKLDHLQRKQTGLAEKKKQCNQALECTYRAQRTNVHLLLGALEQVFIEGSIMASECVSQDGKQSEMYLESDTRSPQSGVASVGSSSSGSLWSDVDEDVQRPLRRQSARSDLRNAETTTEGMRSDMDRASSAEAIMLVRVFESQQTRLRVMEDAFDAREERFEEEAEERARKLQTGEDVESTLLFDHGQIMTTRRLARQVIEAEEALQAAKARAVAAGVQVPGSEVESGFVDDVDDGYRVSGEQSLIVELNRAGIEDWMDPVPCSYTEDIPDVEVDDWDAQSVETCDSASMVAEGRERYPIDKWQAMCTCAREQDGAEEYDLAAN